MVYKHSPRTSLNQRRQKLPTTEPSFASASVVEFDRSTFHEEVVGQETPLDVAADLLVE